MGEVPFPGLQSELFRLFLKGDSERSKRRDVDDIRVRSLEFQKNRSKICGACRSYFFEYGLVPPVLGIGDSPFKNLSRVRGILGDVADRLHLFFTIQQLKVSIRPCRRKVVYT